MQITELVLHPIAIADPPLRSSYGLHAPFALRTIVELKTDSGITGFSETYGGDAQLAGLEQLRPRVTGMDPFQLAGLWQDLSRDAEQAMTAPGGRSQTYLVPGENPLDRHARAFAAIEIACLDVIGKAVGKPVCDVIGGRVRDRVSFSAYLFYKHAGGGGIGGDVREDEYGEVLSAEACVRECRQMVAQYGFREIKLKGGVLDPEIEIESIRALRREFGPTYPLRIDPNCAWSVDTTVAVGRALQDELSDGGYLEDGCATLEGMGEVRRRLLAEGNQTPQASNVAVTCFADVPVAKAPRRRADCALRPALLGRHAPGAAAFALDVGAGHGAFHALQQSPGRQHDGHDSRGGGLSQSDLRLRHALSVADRKGRGHSGRAREIRRWVRADSRPPWTRRGTGLRPTGARPRTLRQDPFPQARRRRRDAQARRPQLGTHSAALVIRRPQATSINPKYPGFPHPASATLPKH